MLLPGVSGGHSVVVNMRYKVKNGSLVILLSQLLTKIDDMHSTKIKLFNKQQFHNTCLYIK